MANELINTSAIKKEVEGLAQQIIDEPDVEKTKDLIELFNWNMQKKNALRILKLEGLLDSVSDQMIERFEKRPGEFSNSDLLNYLQTIQTTLDKTSQNLTKADETPKIQLQQNNQVNVNILDGFDRESKGRIADAIKAILQDAQITPAQQFAQSFEESDDVSIDVNKYFDAQPPKFEDEEDGLLSSLSLSGEDDDDTEN